MTPRLRTLAALGVLALAASACDAFGPPDPTLFQIPIAGERDTDWYYGALPNHSGQWSEFEDYTCGEKTIDFNITTDFLIRDFIAMRDGVDALAAAPGTVIEVVDGEPDTWLSYQLGLEGNHVVIEHHDGIQSAYRNLKKNSITVEEGQEVEAGQVIGQAGSSGESNWPRVGFEARTADGTPFDPWAGECSPGEPYWASQPDYPDEFHVVDYGITNQAPSRSHIAGRPPDVTAFEIGQSVGFWSHVVNRPVGSLNVAIHMPTETLDSTATFDSPGPANTVFTGFVVLLPGLPTGDWAIEYTMNGDTYARMEFTVSEPSGASTAHADAPAPRLSTEHLILPEPEGPEH